MPLAVPSKSWFQYLLPSFKLDDTKHHLDVLRVLSVLTWFLCAIVVHITSLFPLFDSSPHAALPASSSSLLHSLSHPLLRWDAFHFGHIAQHGYVYEYEWAFFPGTPLLMRGAASVVRLFEVRSASPETPGWEDVLLGGALAACLCSSTTTLYRLTLHHFRSPSLAFLAALLSLLPSSPATLRLAGYSEPFFTYLSYRGMLYCTRSQWFFAACTFALAGMFRSNGILLSGFILWGVLVEPFLTTRKVPFKKLAYAVALTSLTVMPFVSHQYTAYRAFCGGSATPAPWCISVPPLIYSYVQAKYWNVGFLRYWTPQQLPNFLISAPILALLFSYTTFYILHALIPRLHSLLLGRPSGRSLPASPFLASSLAPHAIHALLTALTLLFTAHTQIVLRFAATMPLTYWAAAWLVVEHPRWGACWVSWSVVWGATMLVLWGAFLPPA
ncbi:GPI mannosyltransferase 2 [Sparassis latifolia]